MRKNKLTYFQESWLSDPKCCFGALKKHELSEEHKTNVNNSKAGCISLVHTMQPYQIPIPVY